MFDDFVQDVVFSVLSVLSSFRFGHHLAHSLANENNHPIEENRIEHPIAAQTLPLLIESWILPS
jgi:hypothetical protein